MIRRRISICEPSESNIWTCGMCVCTVKRVEKVGNCRKRVKHTRPNRQRVKMAPFSNLTWFAESAEADGCSLFILPSHESRNCSLIDCAQSYRVQLVTEQERISSEKKKMRSTGSTAFGIPRAFGKMAAISKTESCYVYPWEISGFPGCDFSMEVKAKNSIAASVTNDMSS